MGRMIIHNVRINAREAEQDLRQLHDRVRAANQALRLDVRAAVGGSMQALSLATDLVQLYNLAFRQNNELQYAAWAQMSLGLISQLLSLKMIYMSTPGMQWAVPFVSASLGIAITMLSWIQNEENRVMRMLEKNSTETWAELSRRLNY